MNKRKKNRKNSTNGLVKKCVACAEKVQNKEKRVPRMGASVAVLQVQWRRMGGGFVRFSMPGDGAGG